MEINTQEIEQKIIALKKQRDDVKNSLTGDLAVLEKYYEDLKTLGVDKEEDLESIILASKTELNELLTKLQAGVKDIDDALRNCTDN